MTYEKAFKYLVDQITEKIELDERDKRLCTNQYEYAEKVGALNALRDLMDYAESLEYRVLNSKEKNDEQNRCDG